MGSNGIHLFQKGLWVCGDGLCFISAIPHLAQNSDAVMKIKKNKPVFIFKASSFKLWVVIQPLRFDRFFLGLQGEIYSGFGLDYKFFIFKALHKSFKKTLKNSQNKLFSKS